MSASTYTEVVGSIVQRFVERLYGWMQGPIKPAGRCFVNPGVHDFVIFLGLLLLEHWICEIDGWDNHLHEAV